MWVNAETDTAGRSYVILMTSLLDHTGVMGSWHTLYDGLIIIRKNISLDRHANIYVTVPIKSNEMGGRNIERKCAICRGLMRQLHTSAIHYVHTSRCFCSVRSTRIILYPSETTIRLHPIIPLLYSAKQACRHDSFRRAIVTTTTRLLGTKNRGHMTFLRIS